MNAYSLYRATAAEKYEAMRMIRAAGAEITGVSGCGTGYYIQIAATSEQAAEINDMITKGATA